MDLADWNDGLCCNKGNLGEVLVFESVLVFVVFSASCDGDVTAGATIPASNLTSCGAVAFIEPAAAL